MIILKKIIYFIIILISVNSIYSQDKKNIITIKSPETYSFEKQGNVPVNLYTGAIDLKIPIYNITAGNLNIPMQLSYDSSGFIPHKKADLAGMNWSLFTGGKISRKVNGLPDEYSGSPLTNGGGYLYGNDLHGYLKGVRLQPYTNAQVYDLYSGAGSISTNITWKLGSSENGYEGEPDLFSFNVLGLSGKFMIGNDGTVKVESNDPNLKVDITGLQTYGLGSTCMPPNSQIILTDGAGNKYYFGGDFSTYEIAYSCISGNLDRGGYRSFPLINSFNISKIVMNNDETIVFEYYKDSLENFFCTDISSNLTNLYLNQRILSLESSYHDGTRVDEWQNFASDGLFGLAGFSISGEGGYNTSFTLLKKSILSKIKFGDTNVLVKYKDIGYPIKHYESQTATYNEFLVDNIEVFNKETSILKYQFSYQNLGGVYQRPFLTGLEDNSGKKYSFEYQNTTNLPPYYTKGIDHWGFWNGKNSNTILTPFDTYNTATGDYTLNNTMRDPAYLYGSAGLLNKIIYPTKGYTVFEYEPHQYGKRVERNSASQFLPTLVNVTDICGGARIHKQYDYYDQGQLANEKEYKYTTGVLSDLSSGILMNWPRYMYFFKFTYANNGQEKRLGLRSSSNVQENSLDSYNVGYSKVYEINKGNGYIEHLFYNYSDTPDVSLPFTNNLRKWTDFGTIVPENLYKNFKNLYGLDYSPLRGRKSKENIISEDGITKKTVEYKYNDFVDYNPNSLIDNNNYVSVNHLGGIWVQGYKRYFNSFELKNKIVTENLNGQELKNQSNYFYSSPNHLLITSENTTNSQGETLETKYFYPEDSEMAGKPFRNELISKNMTGTPLVTKKIVSGTKVSEEETEYKSDITTSNLLLPKFIYSNKGTANIDTSTDKKITYDLYDDKGNVLQYTPEGGVPVSIIWGYNKTQPIAKIDNINYNSIPAATITNLQTLSNADSDNCLLENCTEQLLRNALSVFRNSLPDAFISTYTYNPLIGVTSITDSKGNTTYYEYDTYRRLKFVKDKDLNVLQKYCYNYKGQIIDCSDNPPSEILYPSIARSGSFTKNNCASGGVPSSVSYNQPVGAVTSIVSQADADSKGLALFNTNGQANANTNGICTFSSIARTGNFTKSNCIVGATGSSVAYTQAVGAVTSVISQADADSQGLALFNTNGQTNANANGTCTFSNIVKSGSFTRNNCAVGGIGSTVLYTVAAGSYTSTTSQAAADELAQTDVNNNGQVYANTNGTCTFSSIARSGTFTKNNCASGGVPSAVSYSQPVGAATSIISQADADTKGLAKFNTDGQVNANTNGTCTFSSIARNGNFTKNNCPEGGAGSSVAFSQAAGAVTSIISQTDADSQGLALFNTNGQANANANGTCTFSNIAKSGSFTKNNCAAGGVGATVIYIVPAGKYNSTISQADADELAQNDVNNNGQAYANTNGVCTFSSIAKSGSFTKNNCAAGAAGSMVVYTVPAGTYTSTISQAAADELAQTDVDNNGQTNANTNGNCIFYNAAISKTFTRNNCPANADPGFYVYTVPYGEYTSTISQAKADQLAQNQIDSYGQNWANEQATCTFYSAAKSGSFTRNNCGTGYTGGSVTYTLNFAAQNSTISQADADNKAESVFYANGQAYANTHGTCTAIPQPVNFLYETFFNASTRVFTIDAWATGTNHNGATMNFTINYIRTSGSAATKAVSVVFAAGEGEKLTTTSLLASSITSVTVQIIKN